ncbi:MAG: flagellar protein FliT [Verrucomicrobia bacterium]|nr:flagellar protein FliT [Verrucomicrobiota bacterium]
MSNTSSPEGEDVLSGLLEWLSLTHAETEAIHRNSWNALEQLQATKRQLMEKLNSASPEAAPGAPQSQIRELVERISGHERSNQQLLAGRINEVRREIGAMGASVQNLKQVQAAYQTSNRGAWQWYS